MFVLELIQIVPFLPKEHTVRNAILFSLLTLLLSQSAHALPIDWHGVFGADATMIDNYRRVESKQTNVVGPASQEVPLATGEKGAASFQSYIFRLNPVMIVNDSATLKGEITSGYGRGGRFGDEPTQNLEGGFGNALYMYNVSPASNALVVNKFYAELYSDTATYIIGRHTSHWGLGAVVNSGDKAWDRHSFARDGLTMKIRLGNFHVEPFWAKIGSASSLTRSSRMREYGISFLYDNLDRDLGFGILYSIKSNAAFETSLQSDISGTSTALGQSQVKLLDIYFKKAFGDLSFEVEVPMLSDTVGSLYGANSETKIKGKAFLLESNYKINNAWSVSLHAGQISGDSGNTNSFDAMYLNPNYQIANLLFRYNLRAVSDPNNLSVYDSYMTNTTYLKLGGQYSTEKWSWRAAWIYAQAREAAKAGTTSFNHERNRSFTAVVDQEKDLGMEIDLDFDYRWNNEITIGGGIGYLFTGDYFAFTNDPTRTNTADDSVVFQVRTAIEF